MRNLEIINPRFMRPSRFAGVSAFTLLALALITLPLAYGAAPDVPLTKNLMAVLVCGALAFSWIFAAIAAVFRWGWKTQCYGTSLICVGSISFLAIVPCLAVLVYGNAPFFIKLAIALIYGGSHFLWCRKFARAYEKIFSDEDLRDVIYEEESDAVYYMRRGDEFVLEKRLRFSQMPPDRYFLIFIGMAICMIPMMGYLRVLLGVPFVHIFLTVAALPVSWMSIGLAYRGYLIFYFYPARVKNNTGKDVYMDLASKHRRLSKLQRLSQVT